MGRVNKEYKFNNLKGLNTLIDKFGLTKGEAYDANNVIFQKYGDKLIVKGRPSLTEDVNSGKAYPTLALGYGNIDRDAVSNVWNISTLGFMHMGDGNLDEVTIGMSTIVPNVLSGLSTSIIDVENTNTTVNFTDLNNNIYLAAPRAVSTTLNCDTLDCNGAATIAAFGAEAGAVALDTTNFSEGLASIKTTITNSDTSENGISVTPLAAITVTQRINLKVKVSDLTNINTIRVYAYKEVAETNGMYWDFTYQIGGQDLNTGWVSLAINPNDGLGTIIGAGIATGTIARFSVACTTTANSTYDLNIDDIIISNQTIGLHNSTNGSTWSKIYKSSEELPTFRRITTWDGRVFGIVKNRVYWSNINDGTDFWHAVDTEVKNGDTNTSTLINGLNSTKNLKVGLRVSDETGDIPSGAVITEITSSTSVTISVAATGTTANQAITFQGAASDDSNWMDIDDGDGDELFCIAPLTNNILTVFKDSSIHRIKINTGGNSSTIPYIREPIFSGQSQSGIGSKAPNSVQNILVEGLQNEVWGASEYLMFASKRGIYAIGSIGGPIQLSAKFPEMKSILIDNYEASLTAAIDYENNTYTIISPDYKTGYIYSIQAKEWSRLLAGDATYYITALAGIPIAGDTSYNVTGKSNITAVGVSTGGYLAYFGTDSAATDGASLNGTAVACNIKFSMYDYDRERFYKLLMNTSSILASSSGTPNVTVTVENENGDTTSSVVAVSTTPKFYDCPAKLYGTHFSQQYILTGGGILHRFVQEVKHTNNKKGV